MKIVIILSSQPDERTRPHTLLTAFRAAAAGCVHFLQETMEQDIFDIISHYGC
jgi:hypothetical protein